jgi:hypothetical protein
MILGQPAWPDAIHDGADSSGDVHGLEDQGEADVQQHGAASRL